MIPSVEQCKVAAANLLGDPLQRKFNNTKLQPFFELAWLELRGEMQRYHIDFSKNGVEYVLAASTTSLAPATAGITNMGEIIKIEEKPYLSSEVYTDVNPVDYLPQIQPSTKLCVYQWRADQMFFVGATQSIQLRIWFYGSGSAATSGSVDVDGCLQYIATRMASLAAYPAGNVQMAEHYDKIARGPDKDFGGGLIHSLLQPMVLTTNKIRLQSALYTAQYWAPYGALMLGSAGGGGVEVGAPTEAVITGTIDGLNDTFTIPSAPLRLWLFLNGLLLEAGIGYTLAGSTITMAFAYIPVAGDNLRAEVW